MTNGTSVDAVVKLVDIETHQLRRFVYIASHDEGLLDGIGPGTCVVRFSLGMDWDEEGRHFRRKPSYAEFDRRFRFEETFTERGVRWADFELTLHPVVGGTARTSTIPEGRFLTD